MTIILLNGCTSAGKSSIASCLQSLLDTPYLLTGIDEALRRVPAEYHNNPAGFQFVTSEDGRVTLAVLDVFSVGVHCALEELELRELARGDRVVGQARGQFDVVHQGMRYHYEVDSTRMTPEALASSILAQRARW